MSIIEQDLDIDLAEDVWGEPLQQGPFSWEALDERARLRRLVRGQLSQQNGTDHDLSATITIPPAAALIDLLRFWREDGDEAEQRETREFLKQALSIMKEG